MEGARANLLSCCLLFLKTVALIPPAVLMDAHESCWTRWSLTEN